MNMKLYRACVETDKGIEWLKTYAKTKKGAWNNIWQAYANMVNSGLIKDFIINSISEFERGWE